MDYVMLRSYKLDNGDDSMFFAQHGGPNACVINGKEGENDPSNTKPVYQSDDTQDVIWFYMHQSGINITPDDDEELDPEERYEFVDVKSVQDSDGFYTDYTMYHDIVEDRYVFVFGDSDLYRPESGDFDWECDSEKEAWEWFNDYSGPGELDESVDDAEYNEVLEEVSTDIVRELYSEFNGLEFYNEREVNEGILLLFEGLDKYSDDDKEALRAFLSKWSGIEVKFAGNILKILVK